MKFFCYERTVGMRWIPVFYAEQPLKLRKHEAPRSHVWEVPADWSFTMAMAKHPAPVDMKESIDDNL